MFFGLYYKWFKPVVHAILFLRLAKKKLLFSNLSTYTYIYNILLDLGSKIFYGFANGFKRIVLFGKSLADNSDDKEKQMFEKENYGDQIKGTEMKVNNGDIVNGENIFATLYHKLGDHWKQNCIMLFKFTVAQVILYFRLS